MTINDIAKEAGVSHGTVSNVLNKRGNVSADKIKLVEEAAQKLGYRINTQAQFLRKGLSNKCYVLVLSSMRNQYVEFIDELFDMPSFLDLEVVSIQKKAEILTILMEKTSQLPYAIICLGFSVKKFGELNTASVKLFEIDTYTGSSVIFDIQQIKEALLSFAHSKAKQSMTFISLGFEGDGGLVDTLVQNSVFNMPVSCCYIKDYHYVMNLYPQLKVLGENDVIVLTDTSLLNYLKQLFSWFGKEILPQFYVIGTPEWIPQSDVCYLSLDYRKLAQNCMSALSGEMVTPLQIVTKQHFDLRVEEKRNNEIKILTIKSPISHALSILSDRYMLVSGCKVKIIEKEYEDILASLSEPKLLQNIDLIRVDMAWLPTYAESIFTDVSVYPLSKDINKKIASTVSTEYTHVNSRQYTFPLDISSQILVYRKDIFESNLVQRQYLEKNKKALKLPSTYADFDKISQFFTKTFNAESPTLYGHSRGLKSPLIAACDFIPRMREGLLKHNMDLSVTEQVFSEYQASIDYTKSNNSDWWEDFATNLRSGETVMEILFSNYASPLFNDDSITSEYSFAYASIPGNQPVIGGGAIGIAKDSAQVKAALDFLNWLYSEEISVFLAFLGGFVPTKYVVEDIRLRKNFPWLEQFERTFSVGSRTKWFDFKTNLAYESLLGADLIDRITRGDKV